MGRRGERLVIDPADRAWLAAVGMTSVSRLLKYRPERLAAVSESSETFPVELRDVEGAPAVVFVKRYRYRGWGAKLGGLFRGTLFGASRARFEYEFLAEMRSRGVPAIRPIAYGEKRRRGFLSACCLVTEGEQDVTSLDVWLTRDWVDRSLTDIQRRSFVRELSRLVRHMHRAGVCHGGLFGRNIQVRRKDGSVEFVLLDPDRSGQLCAGAVPPASVESDLSDLAATAAGAVRRTDLLRFVRDYFEVPQLGPREKQFVRELMPHVWRKTAQERHRVAIGGAIDWVQRRVNNGGGERRARVDSVDGFLEALAQASPAEESHLGRIWFTFESGNEPAKHATVELKQGAVSVDRGAGEGADLHVTTDGEAWLAIVNGEANAFDLIRQRRVSLVGDTRLLPVLAKALDAVA